MDRVTAPSWRRVEEAGDAAPEAAVEIGGRVEVWCP